MRFIGALKHNIKTEENPKTEMEKKEEKEITMTVELREEKSNRHVKRYYIVIPKWLVERLNLKAKDILEIKFKKIKWKI